MGAFNLTGAEPRGPIRSQACLAELLRFLAAVPLLRALWVLDRILLSKNRVCVGLLRRQLTHAKRLRDGLLRRLSGKRVPGGLLQAR